MTSNWNDDRITTNAMLRAQDQERIAALEDDLAAERAMARTCREQWEIRDKQIAVLEAERDALKADAERYRWLRAPSYDCRVVFDENLSWKPAGETLDAAIDAARTQGKEEK